MTLGFIVALAKIAPFVRLVGEPDHRKKHQGSVPVVGGIAILLALMVSALIWQEPGKEGITSSGATLWIFLTAACLLTLLGVIDDRRGMSVFPRSLVEVGVALIVIEGLDFVPRNLGDLLGTGNISMPDWVAYPFTIIAIFSVVNVYNMLDGIDGLLSVMVLITVFAFHLFTGLEPNLITLTIIAALSAFLVSNLKLAPFIPKTFLGDAGSKLLGFTLVSMILAVTSAQVTGLKVIEPVTALYLVGLPLFNMVFKTLRRIYRGVSPFAADCTHIHHLMQELDISHRRSLILIACAGLTPPFIGLMLERGNAATPQQFFIFLGLFLTYCLFMSQAWLIASRYQILERARPPQVTYSVSLSAKPVSDCGPDPD